MKELEELAETVRTQLDLQYDADNGLADSIYSFYNVIPVVFQRKEN